MTRYLTKDKVQSDDRQVLEVRVAALTYSSAGHNQGHNHWLIALALGDQAALRINMHFGNLPIEGDTELTWEETPYVDSENTLHVVPLKVRELAYVRDVANMIYNHYRDEFAFEERKGCRSWV